MPRGQKATVGETRIARNGYHYTRTETEWRLTHHLVAEEKLGRPLNGEIVKFGDGDKNNLDPSNVVVIAKGTASIRRRIAELEVKIQGYQAELELLYKDLENEGAI